MQGEWAMEVNVEKSGVMHMRRRGLKLWRSISIWGVE